jgi:putative hemolysin
MTAVKDKVFAIKSVIKGGFRARMAQSAEDLEKAQKLRHDMFFGPDANDSTLDVDHFDALCQHVLIENIETKQLQACFRIMYFETGANIYKSYSAQFYDLVRLSTFQQPMIEIGRFCAAKDATDPNILRLGWAVLTRYVDINSIAMMFGCSSFPGNDLNPFKEVLVLLKHHYLAPAEWAPLVKSADIDAYAVRLAFHNPVLKSATTMMPSLLRTYLSMGGWVSDHAVIDRNLDTFHVFTCVETVKIPHRRVELLRAAAR